MCEVEGWVLRPRLHPGKCNSDLAAKRCDCVVCGSGWQSPMLCGAMASQEWGLCAWEAPYGCWSARRWLVGVARC